MAQPSLHQLRPEDQSKCRRLPKEPARSPQRLSMAAAGEGRNQLLRVGLYQLCMYSGHKFCYINEPQRSHNLPLHLFFLLTAPLGDLISVKRWRSLSNGHVLLLSLSPVPHAKGPWGNNLLLRRSKPCINDQELPLTPSSLLLLPSQQPCLLIAAALIQSMVFQYSH